MHIVYVDAKPDVGRPMIKALSLGTGYNCVCVTGVDRLCESLTQVPDSKRIIVIDVETMLSGIERDLAKIRAVCPELPIIIVDSFELNPDDIERFGVRFSRKISDHIVAAIRATIREYNLVETPKPAPPLVAHAQSAAAEVTATMGPVVSLAAHKKLH